MERDSASHLPYRIAHREGCRIRPVPWVSVIDLHMHSTVSDGTDSPAALAERVIKAGLSAAALTDHDSIAGLEEYSSLLESAGVEAVPGCEISCLQDNGEKSAHLLCYFIGAGPSPLHETLEQLQGDRATRNLRLIEKLAEVGYPVSVADVEALAHKPLLDAGRPHFAEAVLAAYPSDFKTMNEVFSRLLGESGSAYVPKARVTISEATALATASGAVTVLAHPLLSFAPWVEGSPQPLEAQRALLNAAFATAAAAGVAGAEAYYPRHTPEETALLLELCEQHGLVATGGSDYHGSKKPDLDVGVGLKSSKGTSSQLRVPDSALIELKARRP